MAWTSNLFFAVLLTSITGCLFQLFWIIFKSFVIEKDARVTYICLKVVMLFYMIPFGYICLYIRQGEMGNGGNNIDIVDGLFEMTPWILVCFRCVALLWLLFTIFLLLLRLLDVIRFRKLRLFHEEVRDEEIREVFAQICNTFRISKKIGLYYNSKATVPMIMGIVHPQIILPKLEYTREQSFVILSHELTHYKNHDLFVKAISIIITSIHSFNPMAHLMQYHINEWCEKNCDFDTCTMAAGCFTTKAYFEVIVESVFRADKDSRNVMAAFMESKSGVERRLDQMLKYQKEGNFSRRAALILVAAFVMGSSMTTLAAGKGVTKAYEKAWEATRVDKDETVANTIEYSNNLTEYKDHISSINSDRIIEDTYDWDKTRAIIRDIEWVCPPGSFIRTAEFKIEKGETISCTVAMEPRNKEVRVGIIEPDGVMRYARGSGGITHIFDINVTGRHKFYMENTSDATVSLTGVMMRSN